MGLSYQLLEYAGKFLKHAVGILLLCWRRMLRAAAIVGVLSLVLVEIVASSLTHHFLPDALAQVAIFAFAFAIAYSAALTVFVDELIVGTLDTLRLLEGDTAAAARAAAIIAEREVGEAGRGITRWLGRQRAAGATPAVTSATTVSGVTHDMPTTSSASAEAAADDGETQAATEATNEFSITTPRPRVNARPVRADQLPRIAWAYEQQDMQSDKDEEPATEQHPAPVPLDAKALPATEATVSADTTVEMPAPALPPLPLRAAPPMSESATQSPAPLAIIAGMPTRPERDEATPKLDTAAAETPTMPAMTDMIDAPRADAVEVWSPPEPPIVLPPRDPKVTQPIEAPRAPAVASVPLASRGSEHGIWARISQALVGTPSIPATPSENMPQESTAATEREQNAPGK